MGLVEAYLEANKDEIEAWKKSHPDLFTDKKKRKKKDNPNVYLRTQSSNIINLQQENVLKGNAMRHLIKYTLDKFPEFNAKEEISIDRLKDDILAQTLNFYLVKTDFVLNGKHFQKGGNIFSTIHDLENGNVGIPTIDKEQYWVKCTFCGQAIPYKTDYDTGDMWKGEPEEIGRHYIWRSNHRKKCRKCGKGRFAFINKTGINIKVNGSKEEILKFLLDGEYIYQKKSYNHKYRLDCSQLRGDTLFVYESKNHEHTSTGFYDIVQGLYYGIILKGMGIDVKKAYIIYNGSLTKKFDIALNLFEKKYHIKVKLFAIYEWMKNAHRMHGEAIQSIKVYPKGDRFEYELIKSKSFGENIYILIDGGVDYNKDHNLAKEQKEEGKSQDERIHKQSDN